MTADRPRYRAVLRDSCGNVEPVPDELLTGVEEFAAGFTRDVDFPHALQAMAWQGPDDDHPTHGGQPAYRILYKTIGLIPYPGLDMHWPNMRVRFKNGSVSYGGMSAVDYVSGRNQRQVILPQYGRVYDKDPQRPFYVTSKESSDIRAGGWETTLDAANFIEAIIVLEDGDDEYEARLREGRRRLATLAAVLDFTLGPRGLAVPLAEEVGRVFDDWHWNRRIHAGNILVESQVKLEKLSPEHLRATVEPALTRTQNYSPEKRRKLRLACQWYWRADYDTDLVTQYISWWLVIEALEMPDTTNPAPVRERLSQIFNESEEDWRRLVSRLHRQRSRLVHGNDDHVTVSVLKASQLVARAFLTSWLLDDVPAEMKSELRELRDQI